MESLGVATPALWWSLLYFFCLLTAYYVLRPVRDAMGASADVYAVFPPALVDWAQRSGVDLGGLTLQLLFTATRYFCLAAGSRNSAASGSVVGNRSGAGAADAMPSIINPITHGRTDCTARMARLLTRGKLQAK